jgi:hypothetical protein
VPFAADALGKSGRLGQSFLGESEFGLASEPFGRDAFDMAMSGEQDLWHLALLLRAEFLQIRGHRGIG